MKKFVLMMHEDPHAYDGLSPQEVQAVLDRYFAWRDRLQQDGHFVAGYKLERPGCALRARDEAAVVVDGPLAEAKEVIGGLLILRARSMEHAAELARLGPAFERGWIEIREIDG